MAGALTPIPRYRAVDESGNPIAGAKLTTYLAGTATPATTYNDPDLAIGHANANPVVADAYGLFGPIYLAAQSYKFVLTTSAGVSVWSQDNVYDLWELFTATSQTNNVVFAGPAAAPSAAPTFRALVAADLPSTGAASALDNGLNDFRLTLTTGVPVTTADVTAATTLYCAPYTGNRIALYSSTGVPTYYTSAQFSIAVPATTVQMYSVFAYANAGVPTLELTAWTNDTTPGSGAVVNTVAVGVYTKSGDATRRYLGVMRTAGVSGQTEDSYAKRFLENQYHQKPRPMRVIEATNSWAYNGVLRQANNAAANQLDFIVGAVQEVPIEVSIVGNVSGNATMTTAYVAVGLDSTSAAATGNLSSGMTTFNTGVPTTVHAQLKTFAGVGRHVAVWLETAGAATTTWYGDNGGDGAQSGIHGIKIG